ncbi:MAG: YncE family protein [Gemmatimonadales bacterium]
MKRGVVAAVLASALALTAGTAAAQQGGGRFYVTNQDDGTVSVLDAATRKVIETVDFKAMGYGGNPKPHHIQVEPDGSYWYLSLIGAGKVLKLDRRNTVVGSIDTEVPGLLTLHPTQDLLVFARSMSAVNPPMRIGLITRSSMKLVEEYDVFFPRPHGIVIHPGGEYVFVASLGVNQLASIRLEDGQSELVDVAGPSHTLTQLSVSPDGRWLAATASTSGNVMLFDASNPAKPTFWRAVKVGGGPFEATFTYDGTLLFVTNLDANTVTVLDTKSWDKVTTVQGEGFSQPHGVALSADGQYVYVSNRHQSGGAHDHEGHKATGTGTLVAICIPTKQVASVTPIGHYGAGIGAPVPAKPPAAPAACH